MVRFVQDSIAHAVVRQKCNADKHRRANALSFMEGDSVHLSTVNLPRHVETDVGTSKVLPKYIGFFRLLRRQGNAYTIKTPRRMRTHPTFYVGRLCPYFQCDDSSEDEDSPHVQISPSDYCAHAPDAQSGCVLKGYLIRASDLHACRPQLYNERLDIALDLQLRDCVISTIILTICLTILAVLPHKIGQSVALQQLSDPSRTGQDGESNDL